ncbi:ABC transporter permease [Aestuariivirga sp.]|uniref:ABC transporter permease n=1 Tax=Aestuariivirga sp. TaxID=2650926 RepID=UPI00391A234F
MRAHARQRLFKFGLASLPIAWTIIFMFVPYAIMLTYSFYTKKFPIFVPDFQFGNYLALIEDVQYRQVFLRTFKIALTVACVALALAYPVAYCLVFKVKSSRLRLALYMAIIVPLWVSYLLRAYTWKTILGSQGVLNSFLVWAGILDAPTDLFLYSQLAIIITLVHIFIPFMFMPIYTALEKIPRSLVEASHDLGVGRFWTFLKVTLPLSMPGIVAGITFTFCLSFGDFIAPFLVGGPDGFMIANIVQSQFGSALNWPLGSAISMAILAIVLAVIALSDRFERAGRLDLG